MGKIYRLLYLKWREKRALEERYKGTTKDIWIKSYRVWLNIFE